METAAGIGLEHMQAVEEGDANGSCSLVRERVRTFEQAYAETQKAQKIVEEIRARKDSKVRIAQTESPTFLDVFHQRAI